MARTTNLNLYLPVNSDYVNVTRDISDNMQAIDDAFTPTDITDDITLNQHITINTGRIYKFGKLVAIQIRFTVSATISSGNVMENLPTYDATSNCIFFDCFPTNISTPSDRKTLFLRQDGQMRLANGVSLEANSYTMNLIYVSNQ